MIGLDETIVKLLSWPSMSLLIHIVEEGVGENRMKGKEKKSLPYSKQLGYYVIILLFDRKFCTNHN